MKILTVSDAPIFSSGLANTIRRVNKIFIDGGHEVRQLGWGYKGQPHEFPYHIYQTGSDYYGRDVFQGIINEFAPDVVFTFGDVFSFSWLVDIERPFKWVGYYTIDGGGITTQLKRVLEATDVPILVSVFALNEVTAVFPDMPRGHFKVIHHGVDTSVFKPAEDKEYLQHKFGLEDKFVVGFVGRNQPRKNIPALIQAFSEFAKDKDDVALYMHTVPRDSGWDLYELVNRYGLKGKVYITAQLHPMVGIAEEDMVNIYNLFDAFVLPTTGEGFGLPIIEAQACGIPTFATDHSACSELLPVDQRLKVATTFIEPNTHIEHAYVDVSDIVTKLELMYGDKDLRKLYGERSRENALAFDWKAIEPMFNLIVGGDVHADSIQRGLSGFFGL